MKASDARFATTPRPATAPRPSVWTMLLAVAEVVLVVITVVVLWKHPSQFRDVRNVLLLCWLTIIVTSCCVNPGRAP